MFTKSLMAIPLVVALATPAAANISPVFGHAKAVPMTAIQAQAVKGKAQGNGSSMLYGYYGLYYLYLSSYYANISQYNNGINQAQNGNNTYYYTAAVYAYYAYIYFYSAYSNVINGN